MSKLEEDNENLRKRIHVLMVENTQLQMQINSMRRQIERQAEVIQDLTRWDDEGGYNR